jgi:porin
MMGPRQGAQGALFHEFGVGIALHAGMQVGQRWLPFLRAARAHDDGAFYEASVSAGFGYAFREGRDQLGAGVN